MTDDYKIVWEKLKLPDEKDEDEYDEDEGFNEGPEHRLIPIINPVGVQNPFYQLKDFEFWTGHTNFKLTKQLVVIINSVLGVESLDIVSPYRFHFSVAKQFQAREVMDDISSTVLDYLGEYETERRYE
jgi:hypothetical protein